MNVAIIVAISDYGGIGNLPACRNDAGLIGTLVRHTGKFDEVLTLVSDTSSSAIKDSLAAFVARLQSQTIQELLFYYSGHGEVHDKDFLFLPGDYDARRRRQTSLSNTELDTMLRSLTPALTIKVVDACQSGVSYVKDRGSLKKAIEDAAQTFKDCYFMFSCRPNESSFQDDHLSDFTRALGHAVLDHPGDSIRYKDIADSIADYFSANGDQTPTFVLQASLTEAFCTISNPLRDDLRHLLAAPRKPPAPSPGENEVPGDKVEEEVAVPIKPTIVELVQGDAKRYCSKAEADSVLGTVKGTLAQYTANNELDDLYDRKVVFNETVTVPDEKQIGSWLSSHTHDYFVTLQYKSEEYTSRELLRSIEGPYGMRIPTFGQMVDVPRTRQVVNGFDISVDMPFKSVKMEYHPRFHNIPWWNAYFVCVVSKVSVRLFYCSVGLQEISWDERREVRKILWKTSEAKMKNLQAVVDACNAALVECDADVLVSVCEKYGHPRGSQKAVGT